jgi:hypothetical protein
MGQRRNVDAQLLLALAAGKSPEEAATAAGCSRATAFRRLAQPDFQLRLAQARAAMMDQALGRLASAAAGAADVLQQLSQTGESEKVQLAASKALLDGLAKMRHLTDIEERLQALEAAEKERQQ